MPTAFRHIQIVPCVVRLAENEKGLFGFHDSIACPNCQKISDGFRVHDGDSIFAPFIGYHPTAETIVSPHPVYFTR